MESTLESIWRSVQLSFMGRHDLDDTNETGGSLAFSQGPAGELYRASGVVPLSGLMIALMTLTIVAIVIGTLYSASVVFVPFVKLRGLCTFFAGTLLGGAAGYSCRVTKFRNRPAVVATAIAAGLAALYVSWAVHAACIDMLQNGPNAKTVSLMFTGFDPNFIGDWAESLFENGLWGITGWPLVGIWLVEAGLLLIGVVIGTKTYGTAPFCEGCGQWTLEQPAVARLPVAADDPQWSRIAGGNVDAFKRLRLNVQHGESSSTAQYVQIDLTGCPSCTQSDFVSAIAITTGLNAKGELETTAKPIFQHLRISRDQRNKIEAFAEAMQQALAELDPTDLIQSNTGQDEVAASRNS